MSHFTVFLIKFNILTENFKHFCGQQLQKKKKKVCLLLFGASKSGGTFLYQEQNKAFNIY